ncbi:MAG: HK97 family phage prohead protease [bacterium]
MRTFPISNHRHVYYDFLIIKAKFNLDSFYGKEAYSHIKAGIIDEFSFGYQVINEEWDSDRQVNLLKAVDIHEWSPVLRGANPATRLVSVKADDKKCAEADDCVDCDKLFDCFEVVPKGALPAFDFPPDELTNEQKFDKTLSRVRNLTPHMVKLGVLTEDQRRKVRDTVDMLCALTDATDTGEGDDTDELKAALSELAGALQNKETK